MPLVRFILRRANATTRLANFNVQPNWEDLASNITEKFKIPLDRVGVVFVNEAKATITITGEEQLQDFYKSLNQSSNEIMFVVQDLATPDPERIITSTWSIGSQTSKNSSIIASDDEFSLFCWALKSDMLFSVKIGKSATVDHLKQAMKNKLEHTFAGIDYYTLQLWKLSPPIRSSDLDKKLRHAQTPNDIEGCKLLDPCDTLLEHFTSPPSKCIHIIVQHPPIPSRKHGLLHEDGREAKRQKTDHDLSWLSKVHSKIWNRRDERLKDLVHKVTVTVAHYRELQQRLSTRPNQDSRDDILSIKRDILLNYKSNSNTPGNEQVPANVDEESGDDDPELGSFLPATFEFLDLSSLNLEDQPPRLPLPLFIRPEYSIILEEIQLQRVHSSNSQMVTGQPGTGTTAFLHYMMIKYMLDGIPFLYQSIDGFVYHVYRDEVETIESWNPSKRIVAFVDGDGDKNTPQGFIQHKCVQFILASSPTGASPRWFKQIADFMVQRIVELWTPCEFYVTGIFLHPYLDFARLRESASYFGLNPRRCFQASRSEIHMRSGRLHVTKSIRSIDSSVNIYDLMMGTFDSKHASHAVFEMFPKDENRHLLEARIRAVSKWALKQLMEEYIQREASAVADFYKKITRIPRAGQLRGEMFQLWALNYFDTIDQPTTFRIRNLATSEELDWLYPGPAPRLTFPSQTICTDLWLKIVQNKEPQHMVPLIPNFAVDSILYNPNSVLTGFQMTVKKVHPISVPGLQRIQQSLKLNTPLASLRPSNREGEHWRLIFVVPDYEAASFPLQQFEGTEDTVWAQKIDQYVLGLNEDEIMKLAFKVSSP